MIPLASVWRVSPSNAATDAAEALPYPAPSELFAADVDLHNRRFFGVELLVRKVGSDHKQHIAIHHCVVPGRKAEQAGHSHIVWIVVFDELFAAQGVNDGSLQALGQGNQLSVCARATRAAKDGNFACLVQNLRGVVEFLVGWANDGRAILNAERNCGQGTVS